MAIMGVIVTFGMFAVIIIGGLLIDYVKNKSRK